MEFDKIYNVDGVQFYITHVDGDAVPFIKFNGLYTRLQNIKLVVKNNAIQMSASEFAYFVRKHINATIGETAKKNAEPSASVATPCACGHCRTRRNNDDGIERTANGKPRFVEVVRYIRPSNSYEDSNMYGVTIVFKLDFLERKVDAFLSICNGDNFDKVVGVSLARTGGISVTALNMPRTFDNYGGIVHWFINGVPVEASIGAHPDALFNIGTQDIKRILKIYSMSDE